MTREELAQDLAYARTLAEEGRHAPLIGGAYLVLFGVLLTISYAAQWAVMAGKLPLPGNMVGLIWLGFGICAMIGSLLLSGRVRKLPGGAAISNRIDRNVWQGVAVAILVVVAGTVLRAIFKNDQTAPDAIMASGFGLYGVALYATATAGGHLWLRNFAVQAWVLSGLLWFFAGEQWIYLLAAGGAVAVLIAPGLVMMRREPSTTV